MPLFKTMSYPSWASPARVRLAVILCCYLLCCTIAAMGMWFTHYISFTMLFVLPVLLASWFFKQRGAFLSVGGVLLALVVLNTLMTGSLHWRPFLLLAFIFGGFALIVIGGFVSFLSYALDLSHQARLQAQQAEERQQQLQRIRNQFLLNVSHELRTPLTQLQGYLELLRERREQLDAATQAHFLDQALEGSEELHLLVNNVLDAAMATNGMRPPRSEVLMVAEVVQDTLSHVDPQTRQAYALHLDVPETLTIQADPQYTRQVLRNLLSNAFKYSPQQTAVVISATPWEHEGDGSVSMVRLCVKDAGLGIPAAEAPLLFEQFVRLQRDLSGPTQGTGLGLYISKQLVEAMGGRIWVESPGVPGQGSCFSFTLPHAPPPPQRDKASTL
jgi:signal transduction histidine kinase